MAIVAFSLLVVVIAATISAMISVMGPQTWEILVAGRIRLSYKEHTLNRRV